MTRSIWFFCLGFCSLLAAGVTLDGLPGVRGTYSGESLGHGRLIFQAAVNGHIDANQLTDKTFLRQRVEGSGIPPDTLIIQQIQSTSLRFSAAAGLSRFLDLGVSLPVYADFISETEAEKLTATGLGDLALAAKIRIPLGEASPVDLGLFGGVEIPMGDTKQGIFPRSLAGLKSDATDNSPEFSEGSPHYSARLIFTLNPARLTPVLPLKFHVQPGWHLFNQEGKSDLFLLNTGVEWQVGAVLSLYGEWETRTRLSPDQSSFKIGRDVSTFSAGVLVAGDHAGRFQLGVSLPLGENPPFEFSRVVENEGTFTYASRFQPNFSVWAGVYFSIETVASPTPPIIHYNAGEGDDYCPNCETRTMPDVRPSLTRADSCAQRLLSVEACSPPSPSRPDSLALPHPAKPDTVAKIAPLPDSLHEKRPKPEEFPQSLSVPGISFSQTGYRIMPESYPILDALIAKLQLHDKVEVELRTFVTEKFDDELAAHRLSQNRAVAVRGYLVKGGIPAGRVHARGMGRRPAGSQAAPDATGRQGFSSVELFRLN